MLSSTVRRFASRIATAASPPTEAILSSARFRAANRSWLRPSSSSKRFFRAISSASSDPRSMVSRMLSACSTVSDPHPFEQFVPGLDRSRLEIGPSGERAQTAVDLPQGFGPKEVHHLAGSGLHFRGFIRKRARLVLLDREPRFDIQPLAEIFAVPAIQ